MRGWLRRETEALLDWLLPPHCPLCAAALAPGSDWCAACRADFAPLPAARCPTCALPYPTAAGSVHLCETCLRSPPPFVATVAAGLYAGRLREAIHRFKFDGLLALDRPLAQLLGAALREQGRAWTPTLLVPVPLHRARLRERGFNQTLLLGRILARTLRCPVAPRLLLRVRPTAPQAGLSAEERRGNLRGAFALRGAVAGERILLLDDVMTTGATARECARVLAAAGAEVTVAVLARAPRHQL